MRRTLFKENSNSPITPLGLGVEDSRAPVRGRQDHLAPAGDERINPGLPQYGRPPEPQRDGGGMRPSSVARGEEPAHGNRPYGGMPGNGRPEARQEPMLNGPVPGMEGGGAEKLSIAVIGPDNPRRTATIEAFGGSQAWEVQEVLPYPARLDDVPYLLVWNFDIMAVDLDSNRKFALDLVARICSECPATVMVYTSETDLELLVRCMWAGAREVLTFPLAPGVIPDAMVRAAGRRQSARPVHKALGKLLTFVGAKGGSGTTTMACNFAVSLAKESGQSTVLIDLDLPLGDSAIHLGVSSEHSTMNALQNFNRLDWTLLSKLLTEHESGLMVLSAPGQYSNTEVSDESVQKLLAVARNHFDYVVVDAGSRPDQRTSTIFKYASTIFLVTQIDVTELRNANRIITRFFAECGSRLQIVVNRSAEAVQGIKESDISNALTKPADWKIPNEPLTMQRMKINAEPMSAEKSVVVRTIHAMAKNECGTNAQTKKKRWFDLF